MAAERSTASATVEVATSYSVTCAGPTSGRGTRRQRVIAPNAPHESMSGTWVSSYHASHCASRAGSVHITLARM